MPGEPATFSAVVAMASNRVIGRDGDMPWRLPGELALFKKLTMGHPVVMGRKTFDSLPGALVGRRNIVVSRSLDADTEGIDVIRSLDELAELDLSGTVFVIGGAQIYEALLAACDSIYLTFVFEEYEGDTWFPEFEDAFELDRVLDSHELYERRLYKRRR